MFCCGGIFQNDGGICFFVDGRGYILLQEGILHEEGIIFCEEIF